MSEDERVLMDAVIGPMAAATFVVDFAEMLRQVEAKGRDLILMDQEAHGRQLIRAVRTIRRSGRECLEAYRKPSSRAVGSSEVPTDDGPSGSSHLGGGAVGLDVRQVAEQLEVVERRVVQMIHEGRLSATKHRGRWLISEVSLAIEIRRRGGAS